MVCPAHVYPEPTVNTKQPPEFVLAIGLAPHHQPPVAPRSERQRLSRGCVEIPALLGSRKLFANPRVICAICPNQLAHKLALVELTIFRVHSKLSASALLTVPDWADQAASDAEWWLEEEILRVRQFRKPTQG